jgi:hypothetical protein
LSSLAKHDSLATTEEKTKTDVRRRNNLDLLLRRLVLLLSDKPSSSAHPERMIRAQLNVQTSVGTLTVDAADRPAVNPAVVSFKFRFDVSDESGEVAS